MSKIRRNILIKKVKKRLEKKDHEIKIQIFIKYANHSNTLKIIRIEYFCLKCGYCECTPYYTYFSRKYERTLFKYIFLKNDSRMKCGERIMHYIHNS